MCVLCGFFVHTFCVWRQIAIRKRFSWECLLLPTVKLETAGAVVQHADPATEYIQSDVLSLPVVFFSVRSLSRVPRRKSWIRFFEGGEKIRKNRNKSFTDEPQYHLNCKCKSLSCRLKFSVELRYQFLNHENRKLRQTTVLLHFTNCRVKLQRRKVCHNDIPTRTSCIIRCSCLCPKKYLLSLVCTCYAQLKDYYLRRAYRTSYFIRGLCIVLRKFAVTASGGNYHVPSLKRK